MNEQTYYDDFEDEFCRKCHYSCEFCRGPDETDCETCPPSRERYPQNKYFRSISLVKCLCLPNLQEINDECVPKLYVNTNYDPKIIM